MAHDVNNPLQPDPWETLSARLPVGSRVKGKVTQVTSSGAFVEIEPGIEGFVDVAELKEERVGNPHDVVSAGQEVEVKILDINTPYRKLGLSMKAPSSGGGDYREFLRKAAEESRARLGDALADKLKKK
jgi:small subunit ribosomal protein S1